VACRCGNIIAWCMDGCLNTIQIVKDCSLCNKAKAMRDYADFGEEEE
jgi:hypothetical protein